MQFRINKYTKNDFFLENVKWNIWYSDLLAYIRLGPIIKLLKLKEVLNWWTRNIISSKSKRQKNIE